jgi:hypothetical protein
MERFGRILIIFTIFLIIGVSMSGCSDSTGTTPADTVTTSTTAGPLYTAGDIIRSSSGSESPAWMVIGYDAATDSYKRALIYKNSDGSYGYRQSPATETSKRAMLEKVYTVKITHVSVDSVPTAAPTTVTTVLTTAATSTATATGTGGTTTTTISLDRPSIKGMDPEEGEAGTSVTAEITGSNFLKNLTASLRRSGASSITASSVSFYSSSSVTCTFDIPNTTSVGSWDIVVTNPNGLTGEKTNFFIVHGNGTSK